MLLEEVGEDGNLEMLKLLNEAQADLEVTNYDSRTVAHIAVSSQHWEIVEFLLLSTKFNFTL